MAKTNSYTSSKPKRRWTAWTRRFGIALLTVIGCLAFGIYVAVHWIEHQILTPDNWVTLVSPLPKQPVVSNALGNYIGDAVFSEDAVKQAVTEALPPKAAFLASPLTSQLQSITNSAARKVVASDGFQSIWSGANRLAMNRLVSTARGQLPPAQAKIKDRFNLDLSGSSGQLRTALGSVSNAIPALQPAAKTAVNVSTDLHTKQQKVRQIVRSFDNLAAILPLLIIAVFLCALAVSLNRRRTVMVILVGLVIVTLLELIALKLGRQQVLDQVQHASNLSAVGYIYDTLLLGLKEMLNTVLIVVVVLYAIAMALGPYAWARNFRRWLRLDKVENSRYGAWWQTARKIVASWQYYIWLGIALVILASLALFMDVTVRTALNGLFLTLGLWALIHIVSTPRRYSSRSV